MRGIFRLGVLALLLGILLPAATLQKLSLDDMIQKSTAIVRARVLSSYGAQYGSTIYTHYRVQVSESWKGPAATSLDVVVPGGSAGGLRQRFSGAPSLLPNSEYVLFLWTSRSGLTHILGLTQGLFSLTADANGQYTALRAATTETMIDPASGRSVRDETLIFRLNDLRQRVSASLAAGGRK
jgi:hypothetical protein